MYKGRSMLRKVCYVCPLHIFLLFLMDNCYFCFFKVLMYPSYFDSPTLCSQISGSTIYTLLPAFFQQCTCCSSIAVVQGASSLPSATSWNSTGGMEQFILPVPIGHLGCFQSCASTSNAVVNGLSIQILIFLPKYLWNIFPEGGWLA